MADTSYNKDSDQYHTVTLTNGLRVVAMDLPGEVSYIGMLVRAGSRNEDSEHEGLAHFVEHTVFKGTRHRRSRHISCRMEEIGGELNAYTTKEETMVYTNAPAGYAERAVELLADLAKNACFPPRELDKEREVIIEEIHSYRDSPSDSVYDEFEELIYHGSSLAHNILGSPESVRKLSSEDARGFIDRWYRPGNMVVYCCSPQDPRKSIRLIEKYFGDMNFPDLPSPEFTLPSAPAFDEIRDRDNHQANTLVGTRLFSRTDPRKYALFLFNNYLGGPCMNSRLNMELRERRGLVYTVESSVALLSDTGTFMVYFGTDPESVDRCMDIIHREIVRIASSTLPDRTFSKIRDQYLGQLIVSGEHRESRCMSLAKSLLYFNEIRDINASRQSISAITPSDLREIAELILQNGLNRLTLR